MRVLPLKEASTWIRFDQPVLDTLPLSAVIHTQQESHRLEAVAERLDVTTLGQSREAAQKTCAACVQYRAPQVGRCRADGSSEQRDGPGDGHHPA